MSNEFLPPKTEYVISRLPLYEMSFPSLKMDANSFVHNFVNQKGKRESYINHSRRKTKAKNKRKQK